MIFSLIKSSLKIRHFLEKLTTTPNVSSFIVSFRQVLNLISVDGSAFYSSPNTVSATYQTGQDIVVRAQFIEHGVLANTEDTNFRAVSDDWPVFSIAHDLGSVTTATEPVIYTVGHIRDPALEYVVLVNGESGRVIQMRSSSEWSLMQYSRHSGPVAVLLERIFLSC